MRGSLVRPGLAKCGSRLDLDQVDFLRVYASTHEFGSSRARWDKKNDKIELSFRGFLAETETVRFFTGRNRSATLFEVLRRGERRKSFSKSSSQYRYV